MRPFLFFIAALVAAAPVWAQKSPKENAQVWLGVNCSIYAADRYYVTMYSTQPGEQLPLNGAYDNWQGLGTAVSPGNLRAHIYPGRVYSLYVGCSTWNTADIHFDVPAGYTLYMGYFNMGRTPITSYQANSVTMGATYHVSLELRPNDGAAQLPAAYALPPRVDDVTWAVSLGFTSSGATAGTLRWRSSSVSSDLLNALALTYVDPVTGEVYVERDADGAIKYISAPDCQARIFRNADPATGYTLKFYPWNADPGSDRSFPGNPAPIATYVVSSPGGQQVQIARTQDNITETWLMTLSGNTTSLTQTNGNRIIQLDSTPNLPVAGQRTELITVKYSGQNPVAVTQRIYQNFAWGEELMSETADPGGANLITSYSYFTAGWPTSGNAGKLASIQRPDGSWESYDYYDDFARWGQLAHIYKPWQDNPGVSPANAASSNCQATTFVYQGQRAVFQDMPAGSTTTVSGTQIAGSSVSYGFGLLTAYNSWLYGAPLRTETAAVYSAPGTALTTIRKVFDSGVIPGTNGYTGSVSANPDFAGKLFSQTNPDGTRVSAAYARGNFANNLNANTGSWDATSFAANPGGGYWCDSYFNGASTAIAGAEAVSVWNGLPVDPVYLLPNRSTRRDVIYSLDGTMVVELNYVYTGSGGYKLTTWNETDSVNGLWVTKTDSTGAHENRTYTAGRVNYEKHADGTETQYYFDNLLRVINTVSLGQPSPGSGIPGMGNLEHHYSYDAAGNVLQDWIWDGTNALTTARTFNLAGLPVAVTDPRGLTTACAYTNGGRTVTATLPGGATKVTDHYIDGSVRFIAGTAQVAEYYAAGINGDGTLYRQTNISSGTSPRWTRVSSDWAGRKVREDHPAPPYASPAIFSRQYFYNPAGQLFKSTESGLADTLFQYDGLGELEYTCLDVNANGTIELAGPDRVTRTRHQLVNLDSAWWWQTLTYVYNQDNSTALLQSETQEHLVPYLGNNWDGGNTVASRRSYDVLRNVTTQRVDTNRTNRTVTTTTVLPDSSVNDIGIAFNGGYPVWHQTARTWSATLTTTTSGAW